MNRLRTRHWPIRTKIVALLMPPLVSLLALWVFALTLTVPPAAQILSARAHFDQVGHPTEDLVVALQHERTLSLAFIGAARAEPAALVEQRKRTDAVASTLRRNVDGVAADSIGREERMRLNQMFTALEQLASGRGAVDRGQLDRAGALRLYSGIIDVIYRVFPAGDGVSDAMITNHIAATISLSRAREILAQEDALLVGVAAAGRFAVGEPAQLAQLIGAQRLLFADAVPLLVQPAQDNFAAALNGEPARNLSQMQDVLLAEARANAAVPIDMTAWRSAYDTSTAEFRRLEFAAGDHILAYVKPVAVAIIVRVVVVTVLGLLAILVSVLLSVRIGRSLAQRLTGLRRDAQQLADERLPSVVGRLRRGEPVDTALETPALEYGADEIGELGRAFSAVQLTAVESAVHEATLRAGLNDVFLNIARRSQALLHRQLSLLDRMERRTVDPDELEDLFRVDHLSTRLRRHAEDLVVLAGAKPGRGWRKPVPLIDVVRGAVSEVEDYRRVAFLGLPETSLAGPVVADVIHLLAELIENATSFSPPHTRVQVSAQLVPNGLAVEIEDRGLGMSATDLEAANTTLAEPPDFEPARSARLGLLIVALLAVRNGIRVTLRPSPYGGVTAIVLLPRGAVVDEPVRVPVPQVEAKVAAPATETLVATPRRTIEAEVVELTADGLPRRQRQGPAAPRSLEPPPEQAAAEQPATEPDAPNGGSTAERTPDEIRTMMSSLQAGLRRGRQESAGEPGGGDPAGNGAGRTGGGA